MAAIELSDSERQLATEKLQRYLLEECDVELGGFQVQFLLDFIAEQVAWQFYNQGLADAMKAMEKKIDEVSELIYELEMPEPDSV